MSQPTVAVIGAGPAGLTAAYVLTKAGVPVTVLEADPAYVGGLSRTARYKGFLFDIGGHRFFSKSQVIEDLWTEILPDDMLVRERSSRIYYRGRFFAYPLWGREAMLKLGPWESARCVLSYLKARAFPVRDPKSFEDWVTNQFGKRLFQIFFKTYTEKVWGMSCKEISADWAAQRIKGLSLKAAVLNALFPGRRPTSRGRVVKTLINSFRYPRLGPGMMWEACAAKVRARGGVVEMGRQVVDCAHDPAGGWTVTHRGAAGDLRETRAEHVISSAPLRQLARGVRPGLSAAALGAAGALRYRDFITVVLILKDRLNLQDQWVYIHDPAVRVGRVQNFKAWSPDMVPDPALCCYGLEYFCFEGDELWTAPDGELIRMAKGELERVRLGRAEDVLDGCVVRAPKAYPVYDDSYAKHVAVLRDELESRFPTLHLVGRNGMHKYNNQDHSMMTALLCAENILAGRRVYDLWRVNQDAEYHEGRGPDSGEAPDGRMVPTLPPGPAGGEGSSARSPPASPARGDRAGPVPNPFPQDGEG